MMANRWISLGVAAVLGLGALTLATLPPDGLAIDAACQPDPGPSSLAALLHGDTFWRAQLAAAAVERDRLLAQPGRRARIAEEEKRETSTVEARMSRLTREDDGASRDERQNREAAEQRHRLERLGWIMQCEAKIRRRLGEP
jgi:hypothetical protein